MLLRLTSSSRSSILFLLLLLLLLVSTGHHRSCLCDRDDVVRVSKLSRPAAMSSPLTPSLACSGCEVTVREMHAQYSRRSVHDKFFGTDVELQEVIDSACDGSRLADEYFLAQERFGARLKVFAKRDYAYDVKYAELPQFYSDLDEARYINAVHRLHIFCEAFTDKFRDSHFKHHVKARTPEAVLKMQMCYNNATSLCGPDALEKYIEVEKRKRRRWKRGVDGQRMQLEKIKRLLQEKSQEQEQREEDNRGADADADVGSMMDL